MQSNALNNRRGGSLPLILLFTVVALGGLYSEQSRFISLKKGLVRAKDRFNGKVLDRYLSPQVSCALTQAQSCTSPISVLLKNGTPVLTAGINTVGGYQIKAKCRSADQAIVIEYTGIKESNFDKAMEFTLCSPL